MVLIMNLQNLQQENGTLIMTKITDNMMKEMKIIQLLNLRQKSLNRIFVQVTGTGGDANTKVAFKNCARFTKCVTHINDGHVENAKNFDIIMPMYNLLDGSDNYTDSSGILWQFKRD